MGAHFRFNQAANPVPAGTVDTGRDDIWKGHPLTLVVDADGPEANCEILYLDAPAGSTLLGHHVIGDFTPADVTPDAFGPYEVEVRVRNADVAAGNRRRLVFNVTRDELGHIVDGGHTEPAFGEEQKEGADTSKGWDYRARAWIDALYPTFADKTELRAHIGNRQKACFVPGLGILDWDAASIAADDDELVFKPAAYTSEAGRWVLRTFTAGSIGLSGGAEGQALINHSGKWVPSTNFSAQNLTTTGRITVGGAADTQGVVIVANAAQTANLVEFRRSDATVALRVSGDAAVIEWGAAVVAPTIKQANNTTNGATGQPLTIQAANATGTTSTGGALNLTSGTGTTAPGALTLQRGGVTIGTISAIGLTVGSTVSPAGGRAVIGSLIGSEATFGAIWMGNVTPTATNSILYSNGTADVQLQVPGNGPLRFVVNQVSAGRWNSFGLRIGDNTAATERLEVLGNIKIDTATTTPKFFQADNVTNAATAAALTIQAANATGTTSTGGALNLTSGTGTTAPGALNLQRGGVTIGTISAIGLTVASTTSSTGRAVIGSLIGSETAFGGLWLGNITPSSTNYTLYGGNSVAVLNSAVETLFIIGGAVIGLARASGFGVGLGSGNNPAEKLHVVGSICIDAATVTPKFYQRDVTTNGATGATLTIQAQNATGTTSTGGSLVLQAGAGTTQAGPFVLKRGTHEFLRAENPVATNDNYVSITGGTINGIFLNADILRVITTAGTYKGTWNATGLRIGDSTAATEKLDVVGRAKFGVSGGKVVLDSHPSAPTSHGVIYLGTQAVLGAANYALYGSDGGDTSLNSTTYLRFTISNSEIGTWRTTGLRVGDNTAATAMLDVIGRAKIGVGAGKVVIDSDITFPSSDATIWFGPITPSGTNGSLRGDGTTYTMINGPANIRFRTANTGRGYWDSTGLKIGAESAATAMLEVVGSAIIGGRVTAGSATGKVFADNLTGSATTHGAIWFGNITPSATNTTLWGNGNTDTRLSVPGAGVIDFVRSGVGIARLNDVGLKIGAATTPAFALDVIGSAKVTVGLVIGTGVVTITEGTAVPSAAEVDGSAYFRSGSPNGSIYVRTNGAWVQLGGGGFQTLTVTTTPVTISNGADYIVFVDTTVPRAITLPTPAAARTVVLIDISGLCGTNNITLVRAAAEQIMGIAASYVFSTNWGAWTVRSNGTNWFIQ
jgi:hypothetical protein